MSESETSRPSAANPDTMPQWVQVVLIVGGTVFMMISFEMSTNLSETFGHLLGRLGVGGTTAPSAMWLFPTAFTLFIVWLMPSALTGALRRLIAIAMLWSLALFLVDPVFRLAVHVLAPEFGADQWAHRTSNLLHLAILLACIYFLAIREFAALRVLDADRGNGSPNS